MNIYVVSRTDDVDYDEFDSFVIVALDKELAIHSAERRQRGEYIARKIGTSTIRKAGIQHSNFRAG